MIYRTCKPPAICSISFVWSGLLFLILAAIMVVTRKVDWYALGRVRVEAGR